MRANTVVAAAMGGGKTTLVQALLSHVDENERIDTIEDTPELRLSQYGIHLQHLRAAYPRRERRRGRPGVDGRPHPRRQAGQLVQARDRRDPRAREPSTCSTP